MNTSYLFSRAMEVPEDLVSIIVSKVAQDIPTIRGQSITKVYGFPISDRQCNRRFLEAAAEHPIINRTMNQLIDRGMIVELYIDKPSSEFRIKFSSKDFERHTISYRLELARR